MAKAAKIIGTVLAALAVLLTGAAMLVQTQWAREKLEHQLTQRLDGREVHIAGLDIDWGVPLSIRAEVRSDENDKNPTRYEQQFNIPPFLNLEKLTASHRHGMLRLTVPLKESVKPRRIQIETEVEDQKRLVGAR